MSGVMWWIIPVTAAVLALFLRKYSPEYALVTGILAGILLLFSVINEARPIFSALKRLFENSGLSTEYGVLLFKALGVCILTQLSADACRDAGENGLATQTEWAGKIAILILALPLFENIAQIATQLINGS